MSDLIDGKTLGEWRDYITYNLQCHLVDPVRVRDRLAEFEGAVGAEYVRRVGEAVRGIASGGGGVPPKEEE